MMVVGMATAALMHLRRALRGCVRVIVLVVICTR
jgi:hypothetical protein